MLNETWYYWLDTAHAPSLNMALDEALLKHAAQTKRCIVRFYEWDRPAISIGYLQNYEAGKRQGYEIVRRPTGGGVVYHDHDLTYTVALPAGHWLTTVDRESSYGHINQAVTRGLQQCELQAALTDTTIPQSVERRTMVCFKNPTRYDIMLGDRKVAGNAQRRIREGILHQGSIHFGGPLPLARATLIDAIIAGFRHNLEVQMREFSPPAELLQKAENIAAEKYATDAWNQKR